MNKIGFIGAGNMGSAIMKGIIKSKMNTEVEIFAFDINEKKVDDLLKLGIKKCINATEICDNCDIVFLSIKPQMFKEVLDSFKEHAKKETIFVSIAAGITADYIRETMGNNEIKVILVMPNTPLLLGEGATAIGKPENIPQDKFDFVCKVFNECGKSFIIPDGKMKEIIAVNSSSPAFIYLFAKGFIDYGVKKGLNEDIVKKLFAQALLGSAKMITDSGYNIDELIKMVSSPGGTTLAGLEQLYNDNLTEVINNACEACTKRAYELSK